MTNGQPDLFKNLPQDEVDRLMSLGSRLTLTSGAELFHMGSRADCLYVVSRGRIRLTLPMQVRGQEQDVLVEERTPGQIVGWSALIPPHQFTLTATAPLQTEVIVFSRDMLLEHLAAFPATGYAVALNLAAVIGHTLALFQAMWLREMERVIQLRCA